jgi:hypothetical protein
MLTLSRQRPARGTTCHRCQVIRFFVASAIGLAIFALVADDKLHYLQAVTPMRAALAICAMGIIGLIIKIILWKLDPQRTSADPEQGEPPAAC